MQMRGNRKEAQPNTRAQPESLAAFSLVDTVKDHEGRLRVLESLAWKLVGGVVVGTAIGTTIGGAIVAYLLGS